MEFAFCWINIICLLPPLSAPSAKTAWGTWYIMWSDLHAEEYREFPDSPVVRTQCFRCQGQGSVPDWRMKIPQAVLAHARARSRLILCDPMDCSPPTSSVHGIFQARKLGWVTISSSWGYSQPRDRTRISPVSCIGRWILYSWATWEVHKLHSPAK